jgi:site-specific DNA recombinase
MDNKLFKSVKTKLPQNKITVISATPYYRWSTPGQVLKGIFKNGKMAYEEKEKIIEARKNALIEFITNYRGYCPKCGNEIVVNYCGHSFLDKGESGRKVERESIDMLIEEGERGGSFDAVFTEDGSRYGRRRSVSATIRDKLKDMGIQTYSTVAPFPLSCPDCFDSLNNDGGIINEAMTDLNAELNLAKIRRNYLFGMPLRVESGKPSGSLAYGLVKRYKFLGKDFRGNERVEEIYEWDDGKVKIVRRIAYEFLSGLGTWKISQNLNLENIPSPQGKKWGRSAILCVLRNPIYKGIVRFGHTKTKNGKRIFQDEGKWLMQKAMFDRIWTDKYYRKIQDEIKRRATIGGRACASPALLVGILKCARCHFSMYQSGGAKKKNEKQWLGYGCGTFMHRGACYHNGKSQEVVDRLVLQEVLKLADNNTQKTFNEKLNKDNDKKIKQELDEKKKALADVLKRLERAYDAYSKGIDSLQDYSKHKNEDEPSATFLSNEVVRLDNVINGPHQINWENSYESVIKKFMEHPTPEDKIVVKTILRRLIDKIEIENIPYKHSGSKIKIFYNLN